MRACIVSNRRRAVQILVPDRGRPLSSSATPLASVLDRPTWDDYSWLTLAVRKTRSPQLVSPVIGSNNRGRPAVLGMTDHRGWATLIAAAVAVSGEPIDSCSGVSTRACPRSSAYVTLGNGNQQLTSVLEPRFSARALNGCEKSGNTSGLDAPVDSSSFRKEEPCYSP
jgi:hypothetical protein